MGRHAKDRSLDKKTKTAGLLRSRDRRDRHHGIRHELTDGPRIRRIRRTVSVHRREGAGRVAVGSRRVGFPILRYILHTQLYCHTLCSTWRLCERELRSRFVASASREIIPSESRGTRCSLNRVRNRYRDIQFIFWREDGLDPQWTGRSRSTAGRHVSQSVTLTGDTIRTRFPTLTRDTLPSAGELGCHKTLHPLG